MAQNAEEVFDRASARVSSGSLGSIPTRTSLKLYGLYSIIHKGPAPARGPNSLIDPRGAAKWKAWSNASSIERKDAMVKYSEIVEALESGDEAVAGTLDGSDDDDHEADVLQSGFGGVGMKGYEETTTDGHEGPSRERRQQPLLDLSHWATMGDVKSVQYVLDQQGPEIIDRKDEMGMTALMRAADRNKVDVIEVLLERGADVDQVDSDGQTALHYATFCGHIEATSALLYGGANMNKKDKEGKTAFETGNSEVRDFLTNNHDRIQKARLDKEKARREKTLRRSHQENDADMEDLVTRSLARLNQTSIFDAALVALFALGIAWICVRYNKTPGSAAL